MSIESEQPFRDRPIPEIIGILETNFSSRQLAARKMLSFALEQRDMNIVAEIASEAIVPDDATEQKLRDMAEMTEMLITRKRLDPNMIQAWLFGMNPRLDFEAPIVRIYEGDMDSVLSAARVALDGYQ